MSALELIEKKSAELQRQIEQAEANLFAMQGALQVLEELRAEIQNENQIQK